MSSELTYVKWRDELHQDFGHVSTMRMIVGGRGAHRGVQLEGVHP